MKGSFAHDSFSGYLTGLDSGEFWYELQHTNWITGSALVNSLPTSELPSFQTTHGVVRVCLRHHLDLIPEWKESFSHERKDHRYYQIVEETILQGFEYRYFVVEDRSGNIKAIQPFFLLRQDFVQGAGRKTRGIVNFVRKIFPRFLTIRTLMIGCAAGEGHLAHDDDERAAWIAGCLHEALRPYARQVKSPMVVWKEFPIHYRKAMAALTNNGYTRVPSLPFAKLAIPFKSFEEYMQKVLSKNGRKNLRHKFKAVAACDPITMEVVNDITPYLDEVYRLYLQVFHKSTLQFEKLTPEYFIRLSREMPEKCRFFIWRQNGRAIAFNFCMVNRDELWDEIIGLDYAIAYDLHLYFVTIRDALHWAMQNGYQWYCSGGQGFEPKLHLRCHLLPVDLYVMHTSRVANWIMRRVLPLVEPTRGDKILEQYPNYADLWGQPGA